MVGSINGPSKGNTAQAYQAAAKKLNGTNAQPSASASPSASTRPSSNSSPSPVSSSVLSATDNASNSTPSSTQSNQSKAPVPGAVVAGVVLGALAAVLMGLGIWGLCRRNNALMRRKATLGSIRVVRESELEQNRRKFDFGLRELPLDRDAPRRPSRPSLIP